MLIHSFINRRTSAAILLLATTFILPSCVAQDPDQTKTDQTKTEPNSASKKDSETQLKTATFGGGCFWCVEGVFENVRGVTDVVSGYEGGKVPDPTYRQVCNGDTGHAEACEITYDPGQVSFDELLEIFWKTHDPTTLNAQGNDFGTQYRSVIFFHDKEQQELATEYKKKLAASGAYNNKIVTEISPATKFYPAEDYHQDYYRKNPGAGYCAAIVRPKVEKFKQAFADKYEPPKK